MLPLQSKYTKNVYRQNIKKIFVNLASFSFNKLEFDYNYNHLKWLELSKILFYYVVQYNMNILYKIAAHINSHIP